MLKRITLYGLDFISANDFTDLVKEIMCFDPQSIYYDQRLPLLITPNVDDVVKFNKKENKYIADKMQKASFILPDGQFVVWSSWLLRKPLQRRLPGSDLFPALWTEIKKSKKKIFLIAPDEKVGKLLQNEYPSLRYIVPAFFKEDDISAINNIVDQAMQEIRSTPPDLIFIGIRFPKQHLIALKLIDKLNIQDTKLKENSMPLFLLLGASFEFYLGIKKRAPRFVQIIGMEWFHRFAQEPRRLFKRFFIEDMAFFPIIYKEWKKK